MLNDKDKKLLIGYEFNEQIHMIIKHPERYESEKYKHLEELKIKVKDMKEREE